MWASSRKGCNWGPEKRKAADTVEIHFKGVRGPGEKRAVAVRTRGTGGGGGGAERERSGLDDGTGGVLREDGSGEGERPADGVQERAKTKGIRGKDKLSSMSGLERVGRKWREHGRGGGWGNWFRRNARRTPEGYL